MWRNSKWEKQKNFKCFKKKLTKQKCEDTQTLKMWQNWKNLNVTIMKNSKSHNFKPHNVTRLKNSKCDKYQKLIISLFLK